MNKRAVLGDDFSPAFWRRGCRLRAPKNGLGYADRATTV